MKLLKKWTIGICLSTVIILIIAICIAPQNEKPTNISAGNHNKPAAALQSSKKPKQSKSSSTKNIEKKEEEAIIKEDDAISDRELLREQWIENLKFSNNPEDLILWAVFSGEEAAFMNALAVAPDSPLLHFFIAKHCYSHSADSVCDIDPILKLSELDPDNSAINLLGAVRSIENNDLATAINFMEDASHKNSYYNYDAEYLEAISNSMLRAGFGRDTNLVVDIMGVIAAIPRDEGVFTRTCKGKSVDEALQSACVTMSKKMLAAQNDTFGRFMGLSVLKSLQPSDELSQRETNLRQEFQNKMERFEDADILFSPEAAWEFSDQQWNSFIQDFKKYGQDKAAINLIDSSL